MIFDFMLFIVAVKRFTLFILPYQIYLCMLFELVKVRDQLENIVQTKVNTIIIENEASKASPTADTATIPIPAPRKVSPKNHHAPPIPSSQAPKSLENNHKNQNDVVINNGAKNKKSAAPRPPQIDKRVSDKKGKINIKMTDIESSGTNYSNLEWRK